MAELEKKYSDYQETECKEQEQIEVVEEKLCPPCQPNPDFKLEKDWFEISEAYLNEKSCEYHVRVYETEAEVEMEASSLTMEEAIIQVAALKMLTEFDKPITDGTKIQVANTAAIIDDYYNTGSSALGVAYLVAAPVFNFEQIPSSDDENTEPNEQEDQAAQQTQSEIILMTDGLFKKYNFIRLTLNTYKHYYALAQYSSDSFCIRQEDDIVQRINYDSTSKKMKQFINHLNDALDASGYPKLGRPGLFKSKKTKRIKFVFKEGSTSFEFDGLYVMSENCPDSYEKIKVSTSSALRDTDSAVVYNFLANLESAYNDIVAKETKPWLDWTLDHFFPQYIVDRGNIEDLDGARVGLECLLEEQLGLGKGNVVDSLAREIMSAFDSIEIEYNKQACRELERLGDSNNPSRDPDPSAIQERRDKMLHRYEEEFKNKAFDQAISFVNEDLDRYENNELTANRSNVLDLMAKGYSERTWNGIVAVNYSFVDPETKTKITQVVTADIQDEEQMRNAAKQYAGEKFYNLEKGGVFSTNTIQNSPFFYEAQEALTQTYKAGNEFIDDFKAAAEGTAEFDLLDLIPIVGICGLSKLGGKALNCLTNGISFDKFLDIIIEKTFEHMKVNTLDLFYNQLPYDFRQELQTVIEREFGPNVDLSALFGIKMVDGGDQKLKDFIRSKQTARRIKELFEKYENPLNDATPEERQYLVSNLGEVPKDYEDIAYVMETAGFNRESKTYPNEKIDRVPLTMRGYSAVTSATNASATKKFKPSKYVLKYIKYILRGRKVAGKNFVDATRRVAGALGESVEDLRELGQELGQDIRSAIENIREGSQELQYSLALGIHHYGSQISSAIKNEIDSSIMSEIRRQIEGLEAEREVTQAALDLRQAQLVDEKLKKVENEYLAEIAKLQEDVSQSDAGPIRYEDIVVNTGYQASGRNTPDERIKYLEEEVARLKGQIDSMPENPTTFVLRERSQELQYSLALAIDYYREDPDVKLAQEAKGLLEKYQIDELLEQAKLKAYEVAAKAEEVARSVASGEAEQQLQQFGDELAADAAGQIQEFSDELVEQATQQALEISQEVKEQILEQVRAAAYPLALGIYSYLTDPLGTLEQSLENILPEELTNFEKASKEFQETALGVKVDIVFDLVFDYMVDAIMEEFSIDELFDKIRSYPAVDFGLDAIGALLTPSCPNAPLIYPPPGDFLKSLSVDVCDPSVSLTLPAINIPSISWRFQIQNQFSEIFVQAILQLASKIVIKLASKLLSTLESALCNSIEAAGGFVADALRGNTNSLNEAYNSFVDALNEAFCNDGENPETSQKRADELAEALFSPMILASGNDPVGGSKKVVDIIGSVSTTDEVLSAMVPDGDETNDQFNTRIANAINVLAPEMRALLGSPNQVAYFFSNLGSHLSPNDRQRIRDLLDANIPNLPISSAICLTDAELDSWNDLRNSLLRNQGLTPEQAKERVDDLNNKIEDKVEDIVDDLAGLDSGDLLTDALANEVAKALDPCNPNSPLNVSSIDSASQAVEDQLTEGFYDNIKRSLVRGMTGRNSVLGEAMKDFQGRGEILRFFAKLFQPNYQNSQAERDLKYGDKGKLGQFIMDQLTEDGAVVGQYPKTVGITQRDKILEDSGKIYNQSYNGRNITYRFYDSEEDSDLSYTQDVSIRNNRANMKSFDYDLMLSEKLNDQPEVMELRFVVPESLTAQQEEYLESFGFQVGSNQTQNLRSTIFNRMLQSMIPLNKDYSALYGGSFEEFNKGVVEMLMTDPREDGIPIGYKFGYTSEDLTSDSFTYYNPDGSTPYNLDETEKTLGVFGSDRITALDPSIYGGRYSNPPYFVEPRKFTGWMEIATKAFDSENGCDPKKPPLIQFSDIKDKTKNLSNRMSEDPRLGKDPECITEKPFHHLLDKKTKAKLDGVVRTTIRTYVIEYFLKGYGLLSNLELSPANFDQGLFLYIVNKMKAEMYDLGTSFSFAGRTTIVKEKYWYTFLEQCVEAYQRMIDIDGITPPDNVYEALNSIQRGLDRYRPVDKTIKKKMKKRLRRSQKIKRPVAGFNPVNIVTNTVEMTLQSIAFRLTTDEEEKRNFFDGGIFDDYGAFELNFASLKKLRFFQKMYFIALYERQAIIVMSELIRDELNRLSETMIDGLTDKPFYRDISKSIFSMMPQSTTRVGFNDYYLEKQISGESDPGDLPSVSNNSITPRVAPTDKPQFVVEKYARLVNKESPDLPSFIRNRPQKYVGAISLENLSEFISTNLDLVEENYLSDFFGDLSFVYKGSFLGLLRRGYSSGEHLSRLAELNSDGNINIAMLQNARNSYIASGTFQDFEVVYDEMFLGEGGNPEPFGTTGSTGVKYGMRLSILFPTGFLTDEEAETLRQIPDFLNLSRNEKSFLFEDNSFMVPLVSEEIDVVDTKFTNFDPFSGTERYDIECLINKMVETPQFKLVIDKLFNLKQCSSQLSIYCMETMMPSFGRKVAPEDSNDSENFERAAGRESEPEDEWDGTINKFGKNFLRREFKSMYLARSTDGLSTANDDDDNTLELGGLFSFGNPFDFSRPSIRIPWWLRRKMKTKVYDANGMECADPKKDLQ